MLADQPYRRNLPDEALDQFRSRVRDQHVGELQEAGGPRERRTGHSISAREKGRPARDDQTREQWKQPQGKR